MTRERIIERFMQNVNGRQPDTTGGNSRHDGGAGHWFERQMGIRANADNRPDLWGFECKNATGSQTTFGDWKADYLIWRDEGAFPNLVGLTGNNLRTQQNTNKDEVFLSAFGTWRNAEEDSHEYNFPMETQSLGMILEKTDTIHGQENHLQTKFQTESMPLDKP